jgi:N6-adenosine-specific RNA methylase IME4
MSEHGLVSQSASELTAWSGVELSATGLTFTQDVSYDEWSAIGERLQFIGKAVQFWIGDWVRYGEHRFGEKYTQAVELTGYEQGAIQNMVWVAENVDSSLRSEELSFSHHKEVASLKPAAQEALLNLAEENKLSVRELRDEVRQFKRLETGGPTALPTRKYSVVYADPPWRYEFCESDTREIENQYPTMALSEICELPIGDICTEDCTLLMWATSPKLAESMEVLTAWGFTYRTCAVWDKEIIGMGYYFRQQHELLLVATKGKPTVPDPECRPSSVIRSRREQHSKKPDKVYELIENMYPTAPKIELFARQTRDGWACWGNEV